MTRHRIYALGAAVACLTLTIGIVASLSGDNEPTQLAQASYIGGDGDMWPDTALPTYEDEGHPQLDEVDTSRGSLVRAKEQGTVMVLADQHPGGALLNTTTRGELVDAHTVSSRITGSDDSVTAFNISASGRSAEANGRSLHLSAVDEFDLWILELETEFEVGATGFTDDDGLLLGSREDTRIDHADADGELSTLVGLSEDAAVQVEEDMGPVTALVVLDDGRVAFTVGDGEELDLYVLEDDEVRRVETDPADAVRPVEAAPSEEFQRQDRKPLDPIAPGPDERLLTVGQGSEGHPQIRLVDLDTGEAELLADLEDVEATIEQPVSAAAVGDDLIFLADGRIWNLEDAFG